MAYFPLDQLTQRSLSIAVRTVGDPIALAAAARAQVQALDQEQPVFDVRTLEQVIDDDLSGVKVSADMMTVYALIALILSASGIFALMAYSVSQRTHEIGVRMALGAQHGDVLRMVVGRALMLGSDRACHRRSSRAGADSRTFQRAFGSYPSGRSDFRGIRPFAGLGCHPRRLHSGAAGDEGRSHGGAEVRMKRSAVSYQRSARDRAGHE